jgi:hypothetical protein
MPSFFFVVRAVSPFQGFRVFPSIGWLQPLATTLDGALFFYPFNPFSSPYCVKIKQFVFKRLKK